MPVATHLTKSVESSRSTDAIQPAESAGSKPGRVWPMLLVLAAFWAFEWSVYSIEMAAFTRFMSRWIVYLIVFLVFMTWWMTYRGFRLRDRMLAIGAMFGLATLTSFVVHPTVRGVVLVMFGTLYCLTAWTIWIAVSRNWSLNVRRLGLLAVMALTFGYFTLIRWDGLFGTQEAAIHWRWQPNAEEQFLAERAKALATSSAASSSAEGSGAEAAAMEPAAQSWSLQPGDWPEFRGAGRRGVVEEVALDAADWASNPPEAVWRKRLGPGWSTMIVVDGHIVTQEQRGENEAVVCYDAATGDELWAHEDPVRFEEGLSGPGPRSTPTFAPIDGGRIYTLGAKGKLNCLEATTGKPVWSKDIVADSGASVPQWGYSVSPLVVDNRVIVFAGGDKGKSVLAYDATGGDLVWSQAAGAMSYSSPQLVTLLGKRQVLIHDNQALWSFRPDDGKLLWQLDSTSEVAQPQLQPWVLGDDQLVTFSEPGLSLVKLARDGETWTVTREWESKALKPAFNSFVVHEGHIYGLDDGILVCVELESGKRVWKKGRYRHGQVLYVEQQGALLIVGEQGEIALVEANPQELHELGRFQALDGKTWNHPVVSDDRLFVRNGEEIACYALQKPADNSIGK